MSRWSAALFENTQNNSNDTPNNSSWFWNWTQRKSIDISKEPNANVCMRNKTKSTAKNSCNEVEEAMAGGQNKVNIFMPYSF